jgi:primosomal protein N''
MRHFQLQRVDATAILTLDIHAVLCCLSQVKAVRSEYTAYKVAEPDWLGDQQLRLERRLRDLDYDQKQHRMAQLRSMIAAKQPAEAQVAAWQEELQRLETVTTA